jgi:hypothetical protein
MENYDIGVIKKILKSKNMHLLVEPDNVETEYFFSKEPDNVSCGSNDTRYVLNKKKINLMKFLDEINAKMQYIGSGATGHTFRIDILKKNDNNTKNAKQNNESDEIIYQMAMKVSAYPKKSSYGGIRNASRPENAEIVMLKGLSYFKNNNLTPHLIHPIITFYSDMKLFNALRKDKFVTDKKYLEFMKKYDEGRYEDTVSILLSEWANRGDFLTFVRDRHKKFNNSHWKNFFFQIISVLATIQLKYPYFRHNDLKANNILIQKIVRHTKNIEYNINNKKYRIPNIQYQIKLWDFDFACISGTIKNIKVEEKWTNDLNITNKRNRYYDLHYFFNTFLNFFPNVIKSDEINEFIDRIVPKKYRSTDEKNKIVNKKGRILVNDEYTNPLQILEKDIFFKEFRVN